MDKEFEDVLRERIGEERSLYSGEQLKEQTFKLLDLNQIEQNKQTIDELYSLCLWMARRLPKTYKEFAYDYLDKITNVESERL